MKKSRAIPTHFMMGMFPQKKESVMKYLIALTLLALVGCDSITGLQETGEGIENQYDKGSVCSFYPQAIVLADTMQMTPGDSTTPCADGNAPILYKTSWLSTRSDCSVMEAADVVGGIKGIRRQFGCWKPITPTKVNCLRIANEK